MCVPNTMKSKNLIKMIQFIIGTLYYNVIKYYWKFSTYLILYNIQCSSYTQILRVAHICPLSFL